jgi:hypothetical protein
MCSTAYIEVVGCLWPENRKTQLDRVIMMADARKTGKQKEKAAKIS